MLECFLSDEKHPENVRIKHSVELLVGDFFEQNEFVNAGVVNKDVDLAERFFRFSEKPLDIRPLRDVCLNCNRSAPGFAKLIDNFVRIRFREGVVDHYRCAFCRKRLRDARADSLRRARYHCNFSLQFSILHFVFPFVFYFKKCVLFGSVVHGEHGAETHFAAVHLLVSFGRAGERIFFDHRMDATQRAEFQRVLGIACGP